MEKGKKTAKFKNPLVLFIASASRSGSTLLDLMLGSHPQGVSTGEVRRLQGFVLQDKSLLSLDGEDYPLTCSCGKRVMECPFWREVERRFGASFADTIFKTKQKRIWKSLVMAVYLAGGPGLIRMLARVWPPLRKEMKIGLNCVRLHKAVCSVAGASFVVDSSKSIYHYILLHSAAPYMMRLIVLVRDGRGVAYSMVRGSRARQWKQMSLPPFVQASKQWVTTTRCILLLSRRTSSSDRMIIRYEDLCKDPEKLIYELMKKWRLPPCENAFQKTPRDRHIIGGSPSIRFEGSVSVIQADDSWKEALKPQDLAAFERIAGRFNRKLGYN